MKTILVTILLSAGSFDMVDASSARFDMIGDVAPLVSKPAVAVVSLPPSQPVVRPVPPPPAVRRGYPTHAVRWNVNGHWNYSREYLINHLLTAPEHRGDFSRSYLEQLSKTELQALHDDDHEHRVRWAYVRAPAVPVAVVRTAEVPVVVRTVAVVPAFDFIGDLPPGSKVTVKQERDGDVEYKVKAPNQPTVRYEYRAPKRGLFARIFGGCPDGNCPR